MRPPDPAASRPGPPPGARVALYLLEPCLDASGRVVDCVIEHLNAHACEFLDLESLPPAGTRISSLVPAERLRRFAAEAQDALDTGVTQVSEFFLAGRPADRCWFWHEVIPLGGKLAIRACTINDRHSLSDIDELTGILNGHGLRIRGSAFLDGIPADSGALMLRMAPGRFSEFRDVFGFELADRFIRGYTARLRSLLAPYEHLVARLGHNQFAALVRIDAPSRETAAPVLALLREQLNVRLDADGIEVHSDSVFGAALFRHNGADVETLIRAADMAYARARRRPAGQVTFFEPRMVREAETRIAMQKELSGAIERDELRLVYQPILGLASGDAPIGFEALLRWRNPHLGEVGPAAFIPVAEETGLIIELGLWVFRESAAALARLQRHLGTRVFMAVNISAAQFNHPRLAGELLEAARRAGVSPSSIELEMTETVLMEDAGESTRQIGQLRALGFRLSVDDFGTGYSSLAYLRRFEVDKLKIDRSFIAGLRPHSNAVDIVRAILSLADSLGMPAVAEGVETRQQLDLLKAIGCSQFQGYLLGRPMEWGELEQRYLAMPDADRGLAGSGAGRAESSRGG